MNFYGNTVCALKIVPQRKNADLWNAEAGTFLALHNSYSTEMLLVPLESFN
jgi:hypothetical protein